MYRHLLIPTDGSALSKNAVLHAARFSAEVGASMTVLYVQPEYPAFYFGEGAAFDPAMLDEFNEMTQARAHTIAEESQKICAEHGVSCVNKTTVHSLVHQAIIDTAQEVGADLIVMASHGKGGISALLLGSETQKVLAHSTIPVLVVR